jgi:hypothetical protein
MRESDRNQRDTTGRTTTRDTRSGRRDERRATPSDASIDPVRQHAILSQQRAWMDRWRSDVRPRAVRLIAARTRTLSWSPTLLALVLEELGTDDLFAELVGSARTIPRRRYAHALAVAIALRHSWQPESLAWIAKRLRIALTPAALCRTETSDLASVRAERTSHLTTNRRRRSSAAEKGSRR